MKLQTHKLTIECRYALYHSLNADRFRCLTPEAFNWHVLSHTSDRTDMTTFNSESVDIVANRMVIVLDEFVLSRNQLSQYKSRSGDWRAFNEGAYNIPELTIIRRDVHFADPVEREMYALREKACYNKKTDTAVRVNATG